MYTVWKQLPYDYIQVPINVNGCESSEYNTGTIYGVVTVHSNVVQRNHS